MNQTQNAITSLNCPNLKLFKEGKVRVVYDFGDNLLLVATDRLSAYDVILSEGIPNKGKILTQVANFWFNKMGLDHHLISTNINDFPEETLPYHHLLEGRSMLVKKTDLIPFECVIRGYLVGSGWKDYQNTGSVCGIKLDPNLKLAQKLPEPLFTPATKAETGHDENISEQFMAEQLGVELTQQLKETSLNLYNKAQAFAKEKGIIIADTKFEFGLLDGKPILIDEILTPDSSRFWPEEHYQAGSEPPSFDKQIIRNYLKKLDWNKKAPAPSIPQAVLENTSNQYDAIATRLCS